MTDYTFTKTDSASLRGLKQKYLQQLVSPLDGMWECFGDMADHYAIVCADKTIGYCVINSDQKLLQFYVEAQHEARQIFGQIIDKMGVTGSFLSTGDPQYLSVSMDHQKSVKVNALQYHFEKDAALRAVNFPAQSQFRRLEATELTAAVEYGVKTIGADPDWLKGYFSNLIKRAELFGLWQGGELIATGECRVSETQNPYADLGMTVSESHRKQGLATNILRQLLHHCRKEGLSAICSTERDNIAAQRAIIKSGFVSDHRILEIIFNGSPS